LTPVERPNKNVMLLLGERYSLGPHADADDKVRATKARAVLRWAACQHDRDLLFGNIAQSGPASAALVDRALVGTAQAADAANDFDLVGGTDPPAVVAAAAAGRGIAVVKLYRAPQLPMWQLLYPRRDGDHVLHFVGQARLLLEDLAVLHAHKLVQGDVRAANMVCHATDPAQAWLIDFDLTRSFDARYARGYNCALPERAALKLGASAHMQPSHDLFALGSIMAGYTPVAPAAAHVSPKLARSPAAAAKAAVDPGRAAALWLALVQRLQTSTATAADVLGLEWPAGALSFW
jgi:hypothetical protein